LGWNIPIVGFCSLEAFLPNPDYAVLVDARGGGVYLFFQHQTKKLPIDDPFLRTLPLLASPHPALLQKRLSLPGQWLETEVCVTSLTYGPLSLIY
jgi:tRNA A37 threonylcarbamoyladenosine modification protein TsaB